MLIENISVFIFDPFEYLALPFLSAFNDGSQDYIFRFAPLVLEECAALLLQGSEDGVVSQPHPAVLASHKQVRMHAAANMHALKVFAALADPSNCSDCGLCFTGTTTGR